MLTKALLKIKTSKGYARPEFISINDRDARDLARTLLKQIESSSSRPQSAIEEELRLSVDLESHPYGLGFVKLIMDRADFSESVDNGEDRRWELIQSAQTLRQETLLATHEEFRENFSNIHQPGSFQDLATALYGDLPDFRPLKAFEPWTEDDLLHRYNCALVQGLLLIAPSVRVDLVFRDTAEKRKLFRAIKFHRLVIGDIESEGQSLSFTIAGPLSVLMNTNVYGMRLANFFPHLLGIHRWKIETKIQFKGKNTTLSLNEESNLHSHYRDTGSYIPEGFEEFINSFNTSSSSWQADWSDDLIDLGGQHFCFPDITFTEGSSGQKVHLELFHKWHRGELEKRIAALQKRPSSCLILGICKSLITKDNPLIGPWSFDDIESFSFAFRTVPTPKAILPLLERIYEQKIRK